MKVGQTQDTTALDAAQRVGSRSSGSAGASSKASKTSDTDTVELSKASQGLSSNNLPLMSEKVAAIRKAIEEGKYQIDVQKIADNMISEAARLVQTMGSGPKPKGKTE